MNQTNQAWHLYFERGNVVVLVSFYDSISPFTRMQRCRWILVIKFVREDRQNPFAGRGASARESRRILIVSLCRFHPSLGSREWHYLFYSLTIRIDNWRPYRTGNIRRLLCFIMLACLVIRSIHRNEPMQSIIRFPLMIFYKLAKASESLFLFVSMDIWRYLLRVFSLVISVIDLINSGSSPLSYAKQINVFLAVCVPINSYLGLNSVLVMFFSKVLHSVGVFIFASLQHSFMYLFSFWLENLGRSL